jgi:hypothetical protein
MLASLTFFYPKAITKPNPQVMRDYMYASLPVFNLMYKID